MTSRLKIFCALAVFMTGVCCAASSAGEQEQTLVQQILRKSVTVAEGIKNRRDKAELLHRLALTQIEAGDSVAARNTLTQARTASGSLKDRNWNDLMLFRIAAGQSMADELSMALDTASNISDFGRKHDALRSIVYAQARNGKVKEAISLARDIGEDSALVLIAYEQARSNDIEGALSTAGAIVEVNLRSEALVEIAVEQAKRGEIESAHKTLNSIAAKLVPANALYRAVKDLVRVGDIPHAKEIADTLEVTPPNYGVADALAELSVAQIKLGNNEGGLETVSKVPDEFMADILSRLAEAQVNAGNINGAFETVSRLKNEIQQAHARCRIARAQAEMGDPAGALKTFRGLNVDSVDRIEVLRDIAVSQIKIGDSEGARGTLDILAEDFGTEAQMYAVLAIGVAYAKARKLNDAMNVIAPIQGLMYRSSALRDVALALAEAGDYAGAWKVASTIQEKEAKGLALQGIAMTQTKAGNSAAAIQRATKQIVPFERALVLLGVAEGILNLGGSAKTVKQ